MKSPFETVRSVVVTEKSSKLNDSFNHLTVLSPVWVTKSHLRSSLLSIFADIEIKKIRSLNLVGKTKRFKGREGKRCDNKKFIVAFAGDVKIFDSNVGLGK